MPDLVLNNSVFLSIGLYLVTFFIIFGIYSF
jgi:hypothetical protein